jgi:hypothetical protein
MVKILTMVKDEIDIVRDWVVYHGSLFGFKNLFIIDNFSTDGTFKLLRHLQKKYGIQVFRLPNYNLKGKYMTLLMRKFCFNEYVFPIDIDEFIVYYDKPSNSISCDKKIMYRYLQSLPRVPIFKMNYIQSKTLDQNGYNRASTDCPLGDYLDYGANAKTFFNSFLFKGEIDHGNHYNTNNYVLTKFCLVHFHTRNMKQMKKKIYSNVKGLGYSPFDINKLKQLPPNVNGYHHVAKQIQVLENTFTLTLQERTPNDISLEPLNRYIKNIII